MEGTKHAKVVEDVSRKKGYAISTLLIVQRGKPSTSSKSIPKNQSNLQGWLKFNNSTNINVSPRSKTNYILGLLCQGYWSKNCKYATNKTFETHHLLQDPLLGFAWIPKFQSKVEQNLGSLKYKIDGYFRHKNCKRLLTFGEPFTNLTCATCFQIPQEPNFRKKVV